MNVLMRNDIDQFQIFKSIIQLVLVFVMDMFGWQQFAAKMLFHEIAVMELPPTINTNAIISVGCKISAPTRAVSRQGIAVSSLPFIMGATDTFAVLEVFTALNRAFRSAKLTFIKCFTVMCFTESPLSCGA